MEAARQWMNIRRSIQTQIGNSVTVDGRVVPVYHDYRWSDPDAMRDSGTGAEAAWVETAFIQQNAGRRGIALMQIDAFSRIGPEGDATSDPFGVFIDMVAEQVLSVFSGVQANGTQRGIFTINDYTDPANPTATSMVLFMQSSDGDIGEPDEKRRLAFHDDYRRVTMTVRFQTIQDASGPAAFYAD